MKPYFYSRFLINSCKCTSLNYSETFRDPFSIVPWDKTSSW